MDTGSQLPRVNTTPGVEHADGTCLFQGIPGIELASHGRLWAAWNGSGTGEGPDNYVMDASSPDDGATWSALGFVAGPPRWVRVLDPWLCHDLDRSRSARSRPD